MKEVYIMSVARTPIGSFGGALASMTAPKLGSVAIAESIKRAGLKPEQIQEVYMGNVLTAGIGQAPAKQASLGAGIPNTVPTTTVNKVCSSGMKSIMLGAQSIMLGDNDIVVCGGMESMSNVPYLLPKARWGYRLGNGKVMDSVLVDGLWDPYKDYHMGNAGELCAAEKGFSREQQDEYAKQSYERTAAAYENGWYDDELVGVEIPQRRGDPIVVKEDEEFKNYRPDKMTKLRPAFTKEGTITAANASKINDGAAAVVLMSKEKADELGLTPMAKIRSFADASQAPEWFTTTPSLAMPKAISKAGLELGDVDYFEINEAFSVVALVNNKELGLDNEKVNAFGGAVSMGHPIGCSGARITITLLSVLRHKDAKIGCAGICNGGGGASAIVIEKC